MPFRGSLSVISGCIDFILRVKRCHFLALSKDVFLRVFRQNFIAPEFCDFRGDKRCHFDNLIISFGACHFVT